jgi:hypothetical protein
MDTSSAISQRPGKAGSFESLVAFQVKKTFTFDPLAFAALVIPITWLRHSVVVTKIPKLFAIVVLLLEKWWFLSGLVPYS